jgi:hypothetical protein
MLQEIDLTCMALQTLRQHMLKLCTQWKVVAKALTATITELAKSESKENKPVHKSCTPTSPTTAGL